MRAISILLAALALQDGTPQTRSEVYTPGDTAVLDIPLSDENRSYQCVVSLRDETAIANVVLAFEKDALSIEVKQNRIFVKRLKEVQGFIDCIGSSGALYRLFVRPAKGDYTSFLELKLKLKPKPKGRALPEPLQLVRAMRLSEVHEGITVKRMAHKVFENRELRIRALALFEMEGYKGYVCEVDNLSNAPLTLDPSKFQAKGLEVIGARELTVDRGGKTRLYLVFSHDR